MRPSCRHALPVLLAAAVVAGSAAAAAAGPARPAARADAPAATGHVVRGAILARYQQLGGDRSFLGQPLSDELGTPNGIGRYTVFQGGSIYWSAATGAWEVSGPVRDTWGRLGYEGSVAGFPVSAPAGLARAGAFQRFQGSQIYTQPQAGTHEVHGDIFADWGGLGYENGRVGYPTSDELATPDRAGAYSTFERGAIYWSPDNGPAEVEGLVRQKWASTGWENGALGFPVTDELDSSLPGGRGNYFEGGVIEWAPELGAALVTSLVDEASAVDKATHRITFDSVDQTFTYDANDDYYRVTDATSEPTIITRQDFEQELRAGALVLVDQWLPDPAQEASFTLVDVPLEQRAAARLLLAAHPSQRLR